MDIEAVTELNVDATVAALIAAQNSSTRTELARVLPTGGGGGTVALPAAIVTSSLQASDGNWPNPVRPAGGGMRWFVGAVAGRPVPTAANGLRVGDVHVCPGVFRICTGVTTGGTQSNTWIDLLTGRPVVTDPGTVTPPTPDPEPDPGTPEQPAPAMTVRPSTLVQTVGTWSTTGGNSLVEALSDQHLSGAVASPATAGGDVRVRVGVPPLLMPSGNDILVTLWNTKAPTAGNVTVNITRNGSQLVTPITRPVTVANQEAIEFRWAAADLPIISTWDNLVIDVHRPGGGIEILDVTVQSVPPVTTPGEGGGQPALSRFGGVFGSDLTAAPTSIYTDAKRAYIKNSGQIILGCYDDAPLIVTATATTTRVKITTATAGGNNSSGTGWADSVPIPAGTTPPTNRWRVILVESPSTGEYWEFVDVARSSAGAWSCSRGGKITKTSTSNGVMPTGTGITGSGLALAAPAITLDEAQRAAQGDVTALAHTLGLNLPTNFYAATYYTAPATRSDGQVRTASEEASRKSVPLTGDRVRLKASFDVAALTGLSRAIAVALKTYGAVIMGGSTKPSIICQSGEGRATEPWGKLMGGKGADDMLAWLKADDLELVPAGWMDTSSTVHESPLAGGVVTPTPPPDGGGGGSAGTSLSRVQIKLPSGIRWASGASCRGIEDGSEGMGSPFAQWRGEPCYMGRVWWDANSKPEWTLRNRWENWHASIDCGPGWLWTGETLAQASSGALSSRWEGELRVARQWWASRRDPSVVTVYMSPAHEMNGNWYRWSQNPNNRAQFISAWQRYREIQLRVFPECLLTYNANAQSMSSVGMDWRRYIPGYDSGGAAGIRQWVDCGGVDYYNFGRDSNSADWNGTAGSTRVDQFGAPWGIEAHRRFWESAGLCMTIPEWGVHRADAGDTPYYMTAMNDYMRRHAGTGAGKIPADAYFNLSSGYAGRFAIMGDDVGSPNSAERYRQLTWGN